MKRGKWIILATLVLAMSIVSACGNQSTAPAPAEPPATTGQNPTPTPGEKTPVQPEQKPEETPKPEKKEQTIKVYISDDQLMELKSYDKSFSYTNDKERFDAVLAALQKTDVPNTYALWEQIQFKSHKFDNGTLTIDIHIPEGANLGSGGEQFALDALTQTLFQFEDVKAIDILVDGQATESLMGHVTLEHPIKRP
ncbi:GerMN domain-containing protein [Paenibacillus sp. SC116]|uniref:GerMN domain-containing protein n=1 Tax=Paenibacillus sp. SC116 TaxID=2968986 RepID=UPI00215B2916|nr:GerMN domain-containing protein [Paenibacillus sp. SC116]MCR8842893.1 GerMN domain-containing protein [Paenibacillus sp. SC116]